ncbi:MAG: SBBP repeat-containing protein, partial [Deltaproteobacteria bacterium]|nr:SBBP repeat-containing protein [Deltaproteobacteria bacterium]
MTHSIQKGFYLVIILILLSIQGSSNLEQKNQVLPNQRQLNNIELPQNLNLDPDFGKIPLYFVPNEGQVDETALFYAKTSRYALWLTKEGLVFDSTRRINKESPDLRKLNPKEENRPEDFSYERDVSRLVFINANKSPEVIPIGHTEHKVNYLKGNDKSKWQTNIQTSGAVLYRELYPQIDLKVYGIEKQIEYDFVVKPGGEVSNISFEYKDVEKTRIDKEGNLVVETEFGELEHTKPICYQAIEGERVEIQAEFMKIGENNYGFKVEGYNRNHELIIDPLVLVYSTFLGGSYNDEGGSIAVDSSGSIYIAGSTNSRDFPTKNPIQGSYGGGSNDFFITKINASGTALIYSTYLGGSGEGACARGIAVDSKGAVYLTGYTSSIDFPTQNPIQRINMGGYDAFIAKINSAGDKLIYSTYIGGSDIDAGYGIAFDSEGAAYVSGYTASYDFPTKNPFQGSKKGGYDAFIAKINASGTALIYSTYLGGSGIQASFGVIVDSEGEAYVAGYTDSIDFPTKNPIQGINAGHYDAFITKINASGTALIYSTYLGGSGHESYPYIAVDSGGAVYVTGNTRSVDFPTKNPIQESNAGGYNDAFITKIDASGKELIYSSYLGGSAEDGGVG